MKYYIQYLKCRFRLISFKDNSTYFKSLDYTPITQNLIVDLHDIELFKQIQSEEITKDEYDFLLKKTMIDATRPLMALE